MSELGWWMVITTVQPFSRVNLCRYRTITKAVRESNPEVGSSSTTTLGSLTSSNAIAVLFDRLFLLADGNILYQGQPRKAVDYF